MAERPRKIAKLEVKEEVVEGGLDIVKEEILSEDDHNIVCLLPEFSNERLEEEDVDDPSVEPAAFIDCKAKLEVAPSTIVKEEPRIVENSSKSSVSLKPDPEVEARAIQDSFSHQEDLALHALDLLSPYDIKFIGNHMTRRTEREIERRLDNYDFRKKYFLFQKIPSFLFEVVFTNGGQLKCRTLMLISEKLVVSLVCRTLTCEHSSEIEKVSLEYDGKGKTGLDLLVLDRFISTRGPEKWRTELNMGPDRLEQLFLESRVSFHKYGTSIGHVYAPAKKPKPSVNLRKENASPIVITNKGKLKTNLEHNKTIIRIVRAVGKELWEGVLILLTEIFGKVREQGGKKKSAEIAELLKHFYLTELNPDLKMGPFTLKEDKALLFLHRQFSSNVHGINIWKSISRHMQGRSDEDCLNRLQRRSQSKNELTLDNLDLEDIHDDVPSLYYYNESYCFALTIIPKNDISDLDITSKLQHESRFLCVGTVDEIFLLPCKETALRCSHSGMSTYNFTYNPAKPDSQFETYLKLTFANGLKKTGLINSEEHDRFSFSKIKYSGDNIHKLMADIEKDRFIVPKEQFMMFNQKEDEKTTGGKKGFAADRLYRATDKN